jgi:NADPH:quinone reductase-like Zn-dependent oxidoreductase
MDAAVLTEPGVPHFASFEEPVAGDGQAVVEVSLAGLNPVDITIATGTWAHAKLELPCVCGREAVGVSDGRRVYFSSGVAPFGSMAQQALASREELFDVPDDLSDELAVAIGIAGLAAWIPLETRARLQPGETVLVLGATGVVGAIAVQAAKLLGAGRVVAAGRDPDGLRRAAELGADATVQIGADDDLEAAFREAAGGPIDVTIDPVWGPAALAALRAAARFGRHIQIGHAAAPVLELPAGLLRASSSSIIGYTTTAATREDRLNAYATLATHAAAGRIVVDVERIPLREVEAAWARQAAFVHHKLVLEP